MPILSSQQTYTDSFLAKNEPEAIPKTLKRCPYSNILYPEADKVEGFPKGATLIV